MLPIQKIRADKDLIIQKIFEIRKQDVSSQINEVYNLDLKKRETQTILDELSSRMNTLSSKIGLLYKNGEIEKANILKSETSELKEKIKDLKSSFIDSENSIKELLYQIPNLPHESVPSGKSESDNEIIFSTNIDEHKNQSLLPHLILNVY